MSQAFQFEEIDGGIGLITFDAKEKKVNTFSQPVMAELMGLVGQLEGRSDLRGLLLRSGKPGQFIAGADLNELGALAFATKDQLAQVIAFGHQLFGRERTGPPKGLHDLGLRRGDLNHVLRA